MSFHNEKHLSDMTEKHINTLVSKKKTSSKSVIEVEKKSYHPYFKN